jgi:hypothetical protein
MAEDEAIAARGADGRDYLLVKVTRVIEAGQYHDPDAPTAPPEAFETADGRRVTALGDGRYQLAETGEILTRGADTPTTE